MNNAAARQHYRELVAQVAEKAKARLPQAVNGRVEKAVALVLQGDVEPQEDGTITVYSATDATRRYVLTGQTCTCADFERGQAPDGWCAHRIAAGIQKRVRELLPPALPEAPALTTLPEAPSSANCHITIDGRQVQVTLRDTDETRLLQRLTALLQQYPVQAPAAAKDAPGSQRQDKSWCSTHNVPMKLNHGKDGRTWYSHKTDQGWCKGR